MTFLKNFYSIIPEAWSKDIPDSVRALSHPSAASAIARSPERLVAPAPIAIGIGPQSACSGGEILQ
jgi:hypothetical protein